MTGFLEELFCSLSKNQEYEILPGNLQLSLLKLIKQVNDFSVFFCSDEPMDFRGKSELIVDNEGQLWWKNQSLLGCKIVSRFQIMDQ